MLSPKCAVAQKSSDTLIRSPLPSQSKNIPIRELEGWQNAHPTQAGHTITQQWPPCRCNVRLRGVDADQGGLHDLWPVTGVASAILAVIAAALSCQWAQAFSA